MLAPVGIELEVEVWEEFESRPWKGICIRSPNISIVICDWDCDWDEGRGCCCGGIDIRIPSGC